MAEFNLIQAPSLLRRLTKGLGLKQQHIAPALNEGVQAVVVVEDFSAIAYGETLRKNAHGFRANLTSDAGFISFVFINPASSGLIMRLRDAMLYAKSGTGGRGLNTSCVLTGGAATGLTGLLFANGKGVFDDVAGIVRPSNCDFNVNRVPTIVPGTTYNEFPTPPNVPVTGGTTQTQLYMDLTGFNVLPGAYLAFTPRVELGDDVWTGWGRWQEEIDVNA